MKSLPILSLLFVLIARGTSHTCGVCHQPGSHCNPYISKECPSSGDQCGTFLLEISSAPLSVLTVHKMCYSSDFCKLQHFDVNIGHNTYLRGNIHCCDNETCAGQSIPGLPLSRPNGYYCPAVLGLFSEVSTAHKAICRGTETKCIHIVGHKQNRFLDDIAYNLKGCVSFCPLLSLSNNTHEEHTNYMKKIECTDAFKIAE